MDVLLIIGRDTYDHAIKAAVNKVYGDSLDLMSVDTLVEAESYILDNPNIPFIYINGYSFKGDLIDAAKTLRKYEYSKYPYIAIASKEAYSMEETIALAKDGMSGNIVPPIFGDDSFIYAFEVKLIEVKRLHTWYHG